MTGMDNLRKSPYEIQFSCDGPLALGAYNAGAARAEQYGGAPPFPVTVGMSAASGATRARSKLTALIPDRMFCETQA